MIAVSVIIPVYNVETFIERCVRSLFAQTLENMEFIFIDDCSKDKSVSVIENVLEDFPNRKGQVSIYRQVVNGGPSRARNIGIELAQGEFITFCDSDDWVELDMYETLYKRASNTSSDIALCDFLMEYNDRTITYKTIDCKEIDKKELLNDYINSVWTSLWCMIAKRRLFTKYHLELPVDITYCEDFHLMVRLIYYAKKVSKIDQCLYHYNQCNLSSVMQQCHSLLGVDDMKSYFSIIDFFKTHGELSSYEKAMSWRVLNAMHEDIFDKTKHAKIKTIYPTCHKYILSNPFYNRKKKIYMWLLTHHCRILLLAILNLRTFVNHLRGV